MTGTVEFYDGASKPFTAGMAEMSRVEELLKVSFADGVVSMTAMLAVAYFALKRTGDVTATFEEWRDSVAKVEPDTDPESPAPPA
jgi:hypothetical protein